MDTIKSLNTISDCQSACISKRTETHPCVGYTFILPDASGDEKICQLKGPTDAVSLKTNISKNGEKHSGNIKEGRYKEVTVDNPELIK